jgi:hypothetical protein
LIAVKVAPYFFHGFSLVGTPLMAAVVAGIFLFSRPDLDRFRFMIQISALNLVAGIFLFLYRTFLGAEVSSRQVYAVYCYSLVPLIFSSIMSLSVMLVRTVDVNYRVARFLRLSR